MNSNKFNDNQFGEFLLWAIKTNNKKWYTKLSKEASKNEKLKDISAIAQFSSLKKELLNTWRWVIQSPNNSWGINELLTSEELLDKEWLSVLNEYQKQHFFSRLLSNEIQKEKMIKMI